MRRRLPSYGTDSAVANILAAVFGTILIGFMIFVAIFIPIGWVLNIIDLFHLSGPLSTEGALRIVGIFVAPLGAVMGWFF